jgi:hypothetical protein
MTDPAPGVPALWHYTCDHGNASIEDTAARRGSVGRGLIRPGLDGFVWLTDLDAPPVLALGLTSHILTCDRLAHRWLIDPIEAAVYAHPWTAVRRHVDPVRREGIEGAPGVLLRHWWVTRTPVWADRA